MNVAQLIVDVIRYGISRQILHELLLALQLLLLIGQPLILLYRFALRGGHAPLDFKPVGLDPVYVASPLRIDDNEDRQHNDGRPQPP